MIRQGYRMPTQEGKRVRKNIFFLNGAGLHLFVRPGAGAHEEGVMENS